MVKLNVSRVQGFARTETTEEEWTRNPEWLTMPSLTANSYKICYLVRIDNDSHNDVTFFWTGSIGDAQPVVDWGDGSSTEEALNNGITTHTYDFNNANLSDSLTTEGYKQAIITITWSSNSIINYIRLHYNRPTNPDKYAYYTAKTMELVIAHPECRNFRTSETGAIQLPYLENIEIISANFTSYYALFFGGINLKNITVGEDVVISSVPTDTRYLFYDCRKLTDYQLNTLTNRLVPNGSTNMFRMYYYCTQLIKPPLIDTSTATDWYQCFANCHRLEEIPLYDTSSATRFYAMFTTCHSLTRVPKLDTSNVTDVRSLFAACHSLTSVPLLDFSSVTLASSLFSSCSRLVSVPQFDFSSCRDFTYMFNGCINLKSVPQFDYSAASNTPYTMMYYACYSLEGSITINNSITGNMSGLYRTFFGCSKLEKVTINGDFIPEYLYGMREPFTSCLSLKEFEVTGTCDTSAVQWFYRAFQNCYRLPSLPTFDFSSSTRNDNVFINLYDLQNGLSITNVTENLWLQYSSLSASQLEDIFTNGLGTVSGKTVYITGCPGAATCDRTIATAKGWTVSG